MYNARAVQSRQITNKARTPHASHSRLLTSVARPTFNHCTKSHLYNTSHHSTQFDNFQSPHNAHHYFFFGYFSYIIVIMIYKHIHVFFHFLFFFFKFRYSVLLTLTSNFIQKIGVRFQKCPISINFKIGTCCLISLLQPLEAINI